MSKEFPKMATVKLANGRIMPLLYPKGHVRHGEHVVFETADAEKKYDGTGVPASGAPEQTPTPTYDYNYQQPLWTKTS
jgi:hypothetical protein